MKRFVEQFWNWYDRHATFHLSITTGLFAWQLVHLYWLTTAVVVPRLFGIHLFSPTPFYEFLIIIADYFEAPALLSATLFYINQLRKEYRIKYVGYIILINSQWLHLYWITDTFVVKSFIGHSGYGLPFWLAWVAIGIDYLELPIIYDTVKHSLKALKASLRPVQK